MGPQLLSSPTFHRGVHAVAKKVRQLRHGKDPEEMGGTNIESRSLGAACHRTFWLIRNVYAGSGDSDAKKFLDHYLEELKDQFRGGSSTKK